LFEAAQTSADRPSRVSSGMTASGRSPRARAAITNDISRLPSVSAQSARGRRFADVTGQLVAELGGEAGLSTEARLLVRNCAALTIKIEELQTAIGAGREINLEQLTRLSNSLSRMLARLRNWRKATAAVAAAPVESTAAALARRYPAARLDP
jgi:hypothetical protein